MDSQSKPSPFEPSPNQTASALEARCTVGLLTWNGGEDALRCVESLLAQTEHVYIHWIDNGSTDGTVERMQKKFSELPPPGINAANQGFCVPHNTMIARCPTPFYLALNQDVILAPDYVQRLCDFMEADESIALAGGLILLPTPAQQELSPEAWQSLFQGYLSTIHRQPPAAKTELTPIVHSAGIVFPRTRYYFQLGMGAPPRPQHAAARRIPGIDGAAMMLNVAHCRRVSIPPGDVFPESFFAYGEEIDLSIRIARAGLACAIEPAALALHRGKGSGGHARAAIRARFFANHWLLTVRHDSFLSILADLPYILKGEVQYWLVEYLRHPFALLLALGMTLANLPGARRFYYAFERQFGPTRARLQKYRAQSLAALRDPG